MILKILENKYKWEILKLINSIYRRAGTLLKLKEEMFSPKIVSNTHMPPFSTLIYYRDGNYNWHNQKVKSTSFYGQKRQWSEI